MKDRFFAEENYTGSNSWYVFDTDGNQTTGPYSDQKEAEEMAVKLNVKDKAVKIIQLVPMPDNYTYQGVVFGLGSDGVVYANTADGWEVAIQLEFKKAKPCA